MERSHPIGRREGLEVSLQMWTGSYRTHGRNEVLAMARPIFLAVPLAAALLASAAQAQDAHKIIPAQDIKWGPAPASIPGGRRGCSALRRSQQGRSVLPSPQVAERLCHSSHTHPKPEIVTVITGTFRLAMGENADKSKGQALPAGTFFVLPPGMAHFALADEDTVIQLNSTGPWGLTYVNPADDPRMK